MSKCDLVVLANGRNLVHGAHVAIGLVRTSFGLNGGLLRSTKSVHKAYQIAEELMNIPRRGELQNDFEMLAS